VLEADREADGAVGDAHLLACLGTNAAVGGGGGVSDEALRFPRFSGHVPWGVSPLERRDDACSVPAGVPAAGGGVGSGAGQAVDPDLC
jgi:hypothetical protein